jgi:hypothetical protein
VILTYLSTLDTWHWGMRKHLIACSEIMRHRIQLCQTYSHLALPWYEFLAYKAPYSELYLIGPEGVIRSRDHSVVEVRFQREQKADLEIERRYRNQEFPDVTSFWGGVIVLDRWNGGITSAREALRLCMMLPSDS